MAFFTFQSRGFLSKGRFITFSFKRNFLAFQRNTFIGKQVTFIQGHYSRFSQGGFCPRGLLSPFHSKGFFNMDALFPIQIRLASFDSNNVIHPFLYGIALSRVMKPIEMVSRVRNIQGLINISTLKGQNSQELERSFRILYHYII